MSRTNLLNFLQDVKANKIAVPGVTAGGPETPRYNSDLREKYVVSGLNRIIKNNNRWLKALYAILIALIVFLSIFLWRKQDDKAFFFGILGGQGLSILFCVNRLTYLYDQKRASETLLFLYTTASPGAEREKVLDQTIKFLTQKTGGNI